MPTLTDMKKSFYTILVFTRLNTRRFFRDKLALFFGIAFPIIFLFVFGGISGGSNNVSFKVAVINQSDTAVARDFVDATGKNKIFKVDKEVATIDQANEMMAKSQIDSTIILPEGFGEQSSPSDQPPIFAQQGSQEIITVGQAATYPTGKAQVVFTQNNAQAGQAVVSVLEQQFKAANARYVEAPEPFTVEPKQTTNRSLSAFDYVFAGLLGFSIVGLGIFGPINVFPELKKQGILRRLHTTPLKVWQYFTATMIAQAIIGLVSLAAMFAVAIIIFDLNVVGNYLEIIPFIVYSIITILGIGLAIGGWAANERQAAPLSNIIVFPMLFLSGTFFPRFAMPEWLQSISTWLPLTPVIDGLRLLTTEGKHLTDLGPQIGMMALWIVVIYFIAFKVFRWE